MSPVPVGDTESEGLRPPLAGTPLVKSAKRVLHNVPRSPIDRDIPELLEASRELMKGPPVFLRMNHAVELAEQFQETASHRSWFLMAFSVMRAHVHTVVGVPGDPEPDTLLRDFKSYGSRRLNRKFGRPKSET